MRVLLDTCCLIWAVAEPKALGRAAAQALSSPDTEVFVSCKSCAELACLAERGRIVLDRHWKTWFDHYLALNGWQVLDVSLKVVQEAWSLPGAFHQDPVDRLLAATARTLNLTLLTADRKLLDYPHVDTLW
jgi:PIN domain nuclease of toxin-antitoxin system